MHSAHQPNINARWQDNHLVVTVAGPLNQPGETGFSRIIADCIAQKPTEKWILEERVVDNDFLRSPQCLDCIEESIVYSIDHGCIGWTLQGGSCLVRELFQTVSEKYALPLTMN